MLLWYLIHSKPKREALAVANLERQGYRVYFPRVLQTIRRAGRRDERIVPLFPRYLFLGLNEGEQALGPAASTLGVACVVRFGSRYTVVPQRIIADLQARAEPESGLHRLRTEARIVPGTAVRIGAGPFDGLEGLFARAAGADRVVVLLKLLGQNATVCVPVESIMPSHAL